MSIKEQIINDFAGGIKESFDPELLRAFDVADQKVPKELINPDSVRLNKDKFRLSGDGVFYTLQGEGTSTGMPVVFVRFHVCNYRCTWCDAFYTWNPKCSEFWTESYELSLGELTKEINETWHNNVDSNVPIRRRVVLTGGEPLLQKNLIDELIDKMYYANFEIETNGSIMPSERQLRMCQFNCSPKLANSGMKSRVRIIPDVLKAINNSHSQFKFVVMSNDDVDEILKDFVKPGYINYDKVILMPQGVTSDEVKGNAKNIIEHAKKRGLRLMTRLQCDLWGAKRRV